MIKIKVDKDNIEDEFEYYKKDKLSLDEVNQLGQLVLKYKIEKLKNRWHQWQRKHIHREK
jgi:hypothetical protein